MREYFKKLASKGIAVDDTPDHRDPCNKITSILVTLEDVSSMTELLSILLPLEELIDKRNDKRVNKRELAEAMLAGN